MKTFRFCILFLALGGLALPAMFFGGCSKTLQGDIDENQKPVVWFVNVPPENSRSSVNPIINWYGQDLDGQIDYYRYTVVREDIMGAALGRTDWNPLTDPLTESDLTVYVTSHLGNLPDSLWTVLLVRADSTDPHTSNIIPMLAEMDDPVRSFVPQYVFVQAFDEEGLGSDMAYRRFLRNDNPPNTRIDGFVKGVPFINSVVPSGPATGIRMRWRGSDVVDYPTDAPPFEFQWKLFGPYTDDEYATIIDSFLVEVFVTNDAQVFKFGQLPVEIGCDTVIDSSGTPHVTTITCDSLPTALIVCDTSYADGGTVETCDTIYIDDIEASNIYGTLDTLLRIYDDDFLTGKFVGAAQGREDFYRIVDSSHDEFGNNWITDGRDTIYNAYWNAPADTTQAGMFIFAVRSRDDALVPDLTPAWAGFSVINPQHERDVMVMNWIGSAMENRALESRISEYWDASINEWVAATGHSEVSFDPDVDIKHISDYSGPHEMLEMILKYKVAIMIQDAEVSGGWAAQGAPAMDVMVALQTGVNVWVAARVPIGEFGATRTGYQTGVRASGAYRYYFGVSETTFPGWSFSFYAEGDGFGLGLPRTEHFMGTLSLDPDQWPELDVDSVLLRESYAWKGSLERSGKPWQPYLSEIGALPQVGWCVRTFDSEAMYLFKSKYGNEHAIFNYLSFHGRPVGIRMNRGLFRTVHFMFTPLALERESGQEMVNGVMNWLYDGRIEFASNPRTNSHAVLSADLENRYWQCYWQANGDRDRFYELLKDAY